MATYGTSNTASMMTRPRAHTHTSADSGSPATLIPPSFPLASRPPGAVRTQGLSHGHPGQRTVSASMMDGATRGFIPPSPGIASSMVSIPPPPPGLPNGVPPPPPLKDHPAHSQNWNSWGKAHGPQWTQGSLYQQPAASQSQQHLQAPATTYIPHQTTTTHHSPAIYSNNNGHQLANQRPQDLDLSSERSYRQESDNEFLVNPRTILAANQNQTATISRLNLNPLSSPSALSPELFWTLNNVVAWLERNGFSKEWQDAFRNLKIHGMEFLELGQRLSPNLQQSILLEVNRLYGPNGDLERENNSLKRIMSLVRDIINLGGATALNSGPMSPAYAEEGFGKGFLKGSGRQAKTNATRRATLSEMYDNPGGQSDPRASAELRTASDQQVPVRRSEYAKSALGGVNTVRGASPSNSGSNLHQGGGHYGPYVPPSSRPNNIQESPQNSPSPSFQTMPGRHTKSNSQESIASSVAYKEGSRWGVGDTSQKGKDAKVRNTGRPTTGHSSDKDSGSKFSSGKVMGFFSRRNKTRDDDFHDDVDSPTSPSYRPPPLPFIHENNQSDSSIATASTVSEQERTLRRIPGRQVSTNGLQEKGPLRVFATSNLKLFALVDLTESDNADAIRKALCFSLNIQEWDSASIYHTEAGQTEHEECLTDQMLLVSRQHADSKATLKFFVQPPAPTMAPSNPIQQQPAATIPVSYDTSRPSYPSNGPVVRKPIVAPTLDNRRQSRAPSANFNSQLASQPDYQVKQIEKIVEKKQEPPPSDSLDELLGRLNDFKTRQDAGMPEGPKIDVTAPRSPKSVPNPPKPSVLPSPQDLNADVESMYSSSINAWEQYDSGSLKVRMRSTTESSPIDFNPSDQDSTVTRDELFFGQVNSMVPDSDRQASTIKVTLDSYKQKREMEMEHKRRKEQNTRLQQQAMERGFIKINSPEKKVIDFDNPRASPFEDKSFNDMIPPLVPQRKAPPPPPDAIHRSSIGSLTKKGGETFWRSYKDSSGYVGTIPRKNSVVRRQEVREATARKAVPSQTEGTNIFTPPHRMSVQEQGQFNLPGDNEQVLQQIIPPRSREMASIDSMSGSDSPHTGDVGYTWGQEQQQQQQQKQQQQQQQQKQQHVHQQFTISEYHSQPAASPGGLVVLPNQSEMGSSAPVSPDGALHQRGGFADVSFAEGEITFTQPSQEEVEDESDEDEGLFAVPLAGRSPRGNVKEELPSPQAQNSSGSRNNSGRPTLTVSTTPPTASAIGSSGTGSTPSSLKHTEFYEGDDKRAIFSPAGVIPSPRSAGPSVNSPADYTMDRPTSFIDNDWASRPAPETLIDHLDELFPKVDLDQPIIDDAITSPPPSPYEKPQYAMSSSALPMPGDDMPVVGVLREEDEDNNNFNTSPPPLPVTEKVSLHAPRPPTVAQRNMNRSSGGLGRMKSIREVARGANERGRRLAQQQPTENNAGPVVPNKQDMLRRKSTKLFGARLIEVKPGQGRRAMQQMQMHDPPPQSQWPKRQATFKWFKGPLIGKGTYGRVYLGMNATTGEFLAVKQVEVNKHASNGDSELLKEMIAALNQEIETMQHLDHINIVQYLGCERKEMSISIFLEYIPGGSIGSCLRKHGKFEEPIVRSLTRQTLCGLEYLHREGILHRDLKADNILLDRTGTCKISDFGISKKSENIYGNDPGNSMQGSVFWMAPEVIRPEGQGYSAKIDIWSLGCVVLEMFAGRRPWSKEEAIGAIYKLGSERKPPPIPDDVSPYISPAAIAFLADCHTISPAERPTARTLLDEHPFCAFDPDFDFTKTRLYELVQDKKEKPVPVPLHYQ
ncbi:hypothetical protein BDZ91DRAFT_785891 [Kalaharituber pfeilii]|nr:hypothetical protein BDZ91DRAFT_785891 [Kalaharituber pfeilii]